jgi:hypothetical protein
MKMSKIVNIEDYVEEKHVIVRGENRTHCVPEALLRNVSGDDQLLHTINPMLLIDIIYDYLRIIEE